MRAALWLVTVAALVAAVGLGAAASRHLTPEARARRARRAGGGVDRVKREDFATERGWLLWRATRWAFAAWAVVVALWLVRWLVLG